MIDTNVSPDTETDTERKSILLTFVKPASRGDKTLNSLFPTGYQVRRVNKAGVYLEINTCVWACVCGGGRVHMHVCRSITLFFEFLSLIVAEGTTSQGRKLRCKNTDCRQRGKWKRRILLYVYFVNWSYLWASNYIKSQIGTNGSDAIFSSLFPSVNKLFSSWCFCCHFIAFLKHLPSVFFVLERTSLQLTQVLWLLHQAINQLRYLSYSTFLWKIRQVILFSPFSLLLP